MLYEQIQETCQFVQKTTDLTPKVGIILGTGLGELADAVESVVRFDYKELPHFPVSTVVTHQGQLLLGKLEEQSVVVMSGRFHYYEGYSMQQVTFPVRVMKAMGIQNLFISNISGSTNQHILAGDLVFVKDHINLQPENPLRGSNDERLGPRFPEMLQTYNRQLNSKGLEIARREGFRVHEGVYVALQGPNLETPAEYNFLHRIGGDIVGMSTVPEVIVAKHSGITPMVISVVSNQCYPTENIASSSIDEMLEIAATGGQKMTFIIRELLRNL